MPKTTVKSPELRLTSSRFAWRLAAITPLLCLSATGCDSESSGSLEQPTSSSPTGTGGVGGAGGVGGTGGTGGSNVGAGPAFEHLLISELGTSPDTAEFIEIYNPNPSPVSLANYFISDNAAYFRMAEGDPWTPTGATGTDFLATFPSSMVIDAGDVLVIQAGTDLEQSFGVCPDVVLGPAIECGGQTIPPMLVPPGGGIGIHQGSLLDNQGEMVILFRLHSEIQPVADVDYLTWGTVYDDATRVDKTGLSGYQADTARPAQAAALSPPPHQSIARCNDLETDETSAGGNGVSEHDETSENMASSFVTDPTPSPGVALSCI
jgi:hypothetical protein